MKNVHKKVEFHLKHGALHNDLNIPAGDPIPTSLERKKLAVAKKSGDTKEEERLVFALNAKHFKH
jgi:hypothetical protein